MAFRPNPHDQLVIDGVVYAVAEHPSAPGIAYGQEGRQGIVFKLVAVDPPQSPRGRGDGSPPRSPRQRGEGGGLGEVALKVFKPRYRTPYLAGQSERLGAFADIPGLEVCRRTVLVPLRQGDLLREHPDLIYAALMPWIEGPTWLELLAGQRALAAEESLALARALAGLLAAMEQRAIAHCDLSGPNVLLSGGEGVALVDVEQMYAPSLVRPPQVPSGSLGYAHRMAGEGLWSLEADRFAGAVLLGEMLGWCDERVRGAAWGESYFDPQEMQQQGERLRVLLAVLGERWGEGVARLFRHAWLADTLSDCPTFGEWQLALPRARPSPPTPLPDAEEGRPSPLTPLPGAGEGSLPSPQVGEGPGVRAEAAVPALIALARRFEGQGEIKSALETYREAQAVAGPESGLGRELGLIVAGLEAAQVEAAKPTEQEPPRQTVQPAAAVPEQGTRAGGRGRPQGRGASPWALTIGGGVALLVGVACLAGVGLLRGLFKPVPTPTTRIVTATLGPTQVAQVLPTQTPHIITVTPPPTVTPSATSTSTPVPPTRVPTVNPLLLSLAPGVTLELVRVPAGEFAMGSTEYDEEKPVQTVHLGEYLIGRYEVTVAQFRTFVQATGYRTTAETAGGAYVYTGQGWEEVRGADWQHPRGPGSDTQDNQPVTQVSWDDAVAFCRWASEKTGRAVRLPTEAEWEKAARGMDGRRYPWGNGDVAGNLLNFADRNWKADNADKSIDDGYEFTAPVGSYPAGASPYGALDMAGNVWEWTSSLYRPYPYKADDGREDGKSRDARVVRGGGLYNDVRFVRSASRIWGGPAARYDYRGLRVCVSSI